MNKKFWDNEIMRDAATRQEQESSGAAEWRHNLSTTLAESIFLLETDDEGWRSTVRWMLTTEDQQKTLTDFDCSTLNKDFVEFARQAVKHEVCESHFTR